MILQAGEVVMLRNGEIKSVARFVDPYFIFSLELCDGTHRLPNGRFCRNRITMFDVIARRSEGDLFICDASQ